MNETQKISQMCWESYAPLLKDIWHGRANRKTFAELDKLLLEDLADHHAASNVRILQTLLWRTINWAAASDRNRDLLFDMAANPVTISALLDMRFLEKDMPELVDPQTATAAARKLGATMKRWLTRAHDGELYYAVYDDLIDAVVTGVVRREIERKERAAARCAAIKEELVAAAWAPARVASWVEAGLELEAL